MSPDILEVRALAKSGAAGPIGPKYERRYWHEGTQTWETTPDEGPSGPEDSAGSG